MARLKARTKAAAVGTAVVVLAVLAFVGPRLSPAPSGTPLFGALYPVNPDGYSVDEDTCVAPAMQYGEGQPDWGEGFIGGAGGINLNFTGEPERHVQAVRSLVPATCRIYVRIVPYSSADARALQSRVVVGPQTLHGVAVDVTIVGFDPILDKVTVGVSSLTPQVRTELEMLYPKDMIDIRTEQLPVPE